MAQVSSNPYRRPVPTGADYLGGGKFYLANDSGSYGLKTQSIHLAVCSEYIWVNEGLSIPLSAITDLGRSKDGGYIEYWDALTGAEVRFNFTKLGLLRFDRKGMDRFLDFLRANLPTQTQVEAQSQPNHEQQPDQEAIQPEEFHCERCESTDVGVYVLSVFRFIGFAPIIFFYSLSPFRYVLCVDHARTQTIQCCKKTAFYGYLGFPGFLAAPWYICKNLLYLRSVGVNDKRTTAICVLGCIVLPYILIAALILWLVYS